MKRCKSHIKGFDTDDAIIDSATYLLSNFDNDNR